MSRRSLARLDRVLGKAGSWDNTLLRSIHADTESPPIVVFMKHANQLSSAKLELVLHGRLEIQLDAVDIVRSRSWSVGGSTSDSNRRRSGRCRARRGRNIFGPSRARRDAVKVGFDARWCRKGCRVWCGFSCRDCFSRIGEVCAGG